MRLTFNMKTYNRFRLNLYCNELLIRATNVTVISVDHVSAVAALSVIFDKTRQNLPFAKEVREAAMIKFTYSTNIILKLEVGIYPEISPPHYCIRSLCAPPWPKAQ
jgi:hypothetical protein